jgi:hypothetical protein
MNRLDSIAINSQPKAFELKIMKSAKADFILKRPLASQLYMTIIFESNYGIFLKFVVK